MAEPDTETWLTTGELDVPITRVRIVVGPDAGAAQELASDAVIVGTSERADLQLGDPAVSALHCELTREAAGVRLRDLGSKNGCWLAGQRVFDVVLSPAARVRLGQTELEMEVDRARLRGTRWSGGPYLGPMIGHSAAMQRVFASAARASERRTHVLLRGDSGTGKETLARAIHARGDADGGAPFVVVECALLSRGLAETELFGHVRGAFTGAFEDRAGAFERAAGGTLLLARVDTLPLALQPMLLRALDRGEVRRVGSEAAVSVDVRAIATTQESLERLANEGAFREDLIHRLGTLEIRLPPLRDRREDVPELARRFLQETGRDEDPEVVRVIEAELGRRHAYGWPGNARELRALVRRLAWLGAEHGALDEDESVEEMPGIDPRVPYHETKERVLRWLERRYFARLLDEVGGNVSEAARRAGVNRTHLHELLKRR